MTTKKAKLDGIEDLKKPGAKNDAGKLRFELTDRRADEALVAVMTLGAHKYTPNGWREVAEAFERYDGALMRHRAAFRKFLETGNPDERIDAETGLPHTAQMLCNAHFLCALDLVENDDCFDGAIAAKEAIARWNKRLEEEKKRA